MVRQRLITANTVSNRATANATLLSSLVRSFQEFGL